MTSPHLCPFGPFMFAGSVGQSGARRYGLGSADGLWTAVSLPSWTCAVTARAATTTALVISVEPTRPAGNILDFQRRTDIGYPPGPPRPDSRHVTLAVSAACYGS